jgi:hypothetical protein
VPDVSLFSLRTDDVRALSEARFGGEVQVGRAFRRAFDKAVRTKPPVVAADAGPMQIQWREGAVSNWAGAMRRSAQDNSAWLGAGGSAKLSLTEGVEKR